MFRFICCCSIVAVFQAFCLMPSPAGAWTNGQEADTVVGQQDFTSSDFNTTQTTLTYPSAVCIDHSTGSVFVADEGNSRMLRWSSTNAYISGSAASGVLGQADFTSASGNRGGAAAANTLKQPAGCVVSSSGTLFVADSANSRVLRFDNAAAKANGAPADGVLGQSDFTSGSYGTTSTTMYAPRGLALDSGGRLWVADRSNNRVLRFDDAVNKADGAAADGVLGQSDFVSSTQVTTQNGMNRPGGVAVSSGVLFVGDNTNNRVLRFDDAANKANGADADGVLGQADYTSSGTSTTSTGMDSPRGIAISSTGDLFVVESTNHRVMYFINAASKADGAAADNVFGQTDFTSKTSATTASGLYYPYGVFYDDSKERLWVADYGHNRVLSYLKPASVPYELIPSVSEYGFLLLALILAGTVLVRNRYSRGRV